MPRAYIVSRSDYRAMVAEALSYRGTETGGTGLGVHQEQEIIKVINVPAGPQAHRARAHYSPDTEWQQGIVDVIKRRWPHLIYVSDWHIHPGSFDQPSSHDLDTARRIVSDDEWDSPAVVFPIGVIEEGRVRFRAYLMTRDDLQFQEIPLQIVPDNDPRITEALTGMDAAQKEASHAGEEAHDSRGERRSRRTRGLLRRVAASLWRRSAR